MNVLDLAIQEISQETGLTIPEIKRRVKLQ